MTAILSLLSHWVEISSAISALVIAARIAVKLTPTPDDDSKLEKVITVLKHIGLTSDTLEKK